MQTHSPTHSPHSPVAEQREQLLEEILARSTQDRSFRAQLLAAPKEVIFSEFGVRIPHGYRLRFIERDPNLDSLVVLPDFDGTNGCDELSDDDLDNVCGGDGTGGDPGW